MNKAYFSLEKSNQIATLNIYGDITSMPWFENDVSSHNLSKQLEALGDVTQIDVFINSYGGEVAEGLAIYNALKRHKAHVTTYCDGFACSIASVIFMAGDTRIMNEASLLMIHNAWTSVVGNADELRKQADDLEKITQASVEAYKSVSSLSEEEIKALMNNETWILPDEAIEYGFATAIGVNEKDKANQSAFFKILEILKAHRQAVEDDEEEEETPEDDEPSDEEETPTDEDEEEENEEEEEESSHEEKTNQLAGFFNALLKM